MPVRVLSPRHHRFTPAQIHALNRQHPNIIMRRKEVKRTSLIIVSVLVLLSIALTACQPASTKVRVATDATFPPFETVDEATKELTGFDVELMNALAAKAGIEIEWVNIGFDPMLAGLSQCQYDVAIAAITITEDRKKDMLFSEPYINAGQIISVNKSNTEITGPDSLAGKKVGAQLGTTGAIEAEKIAGVELKTYDSYDLAFLDLANGQIDAVIADYPTALGFIGQNSDKLTTVGEVFTDESYGIAVCKKNTDLLKKINDGLAAIKADGTVQKLELKWLAGQ